MDLPDKYGYVVLVHTNYSSSKYNKKGSVSLIIKNNHYDTWGWLNSLLQEQHYRFKKLFILKKMDGSNYFLSYNLFFRKY